MPTLAIIMLILITGGVINIYSPIGGWYPEGFDNSEIYAGVWLNENAQIPSYVATDLRLTKMLYGLFPRGTARFRFIQMNHTLFVDEDQIMRDFKNLQYPLYFLTSELMENQFINEFLSHPIQVNCSQALDQSSSVAKIFAIFRSRIYTSISTE
jgi:hypothetical protein